MNGVQQWIFQRVTNALLVVFGAILLVTVLNGVSYEELSGLFSNTAFQIFAIVTLVMGCLNSLLAGWQIVGDYAKKFHLPPTLLMVVIMVVTAAYLILGLGALL